MTALTIANSPVPQHVYDGAACAGTDPELFFPAAGDRATEAKKICRRCPVVLDCYTYAAPLYDLHGIWGGTSAGERRDIRQIKPRQRKAA